VPDLSAAVSGLVVDASYVVTDRDEALIAVVRPCRARPQGGVPKWGMSNCVLVLEQDGEAGLAASQPRPTKSDLNVWRNGAHVGVIRRPRWVAKRDAFLTFEDSTGSGGSVVPSEPRGVWWVLDAADRRVATVTPREPTVSPLSQEGKPQGGRFARWVDTLKQDFRSPPDGCDVVETGLAFDWDRHGLLVALAALCDSDVRRRSMQQQGGGG
jgi:hypothetical protein